METSKSESTFNTGRHVEVKNDYDIESVTDMAGIRCSRITSMSESHSDPECTEKILQEKENDLELAAHIGKILLQRNEELQRKNELLEEQVGHTNDQVTQLRHELQRKSDLLRVFTDDENGDETVDFKRTQERKSSSHIHRRVLLLEEENSSLKLEINKLKALAQMLQEKEEQLVGEFLRKMAESKRQMKIAHSELMEVQQEYHTKEDKIRSLNKQLMDKSKSIQQLEEENDELAAKVRIVQGIQVDLAQELTDLKERYAEVLSMLASAKEELNEAQNTRCSKWSTREDSLYDSLASELELSDSGYSTNSKYTYSATQNGGHVTGHQTLDSGRHQTKLPVEKESSNTENERKAQKVDIEQKELHAVECFSEGLSEEDVICKPIESSLEASEKAKGIMRNIEAALESPMCMKGSLACRYNTRIGVPGTPGSKDLELAIERLSHQSNKQSTEQEDATETRKALPHNASKIPPPRAELMLVVPVEGSNTLAHWRHLATPSGIDPRSWEKLPGINVKNGVGSANSPRFPTPRKHCSIASLFASISKSPTSSNIQEQASVKAEQADQQEAQSSASLMYPFSTGQLSHCDPNNKHAENANKPGLNLTAQCAALMNSVGGDWFTLGNTAEKTSSSVGQCKVNASDKRPATSSKSSTKNGFHGNLLDLQLDEGIVSNGIVMRTGLKDT